MSKLKDDARWLVDQITASNEAVKALSKPQLGTSSIESGAIEEYDGEGTLVSVVGSQFDGTHGSVTVAGPTPPEPVAPSVTVNAGQVEVRWSGKFLDDAVSPMDFSHVSVHVSDVEIFEPDNTSQKATITGESGDIASILLGPGEWSVLLVAVSKAGKWSDPSDTVTVIVEDPISADTVLDSLIELDEKYDGMITEAGNLGAKLETAEAELTVHEGRLVDAEADLTNAFGMLDTVDSRISTAKAASALDAKAKADAAEAAAVAAAALVAQSKANTAESNAKTAAALDAASKAASAQAAAISAAKTASDLSASGAKSEAIAAAQLDATAKADAAREAAKTAAALDAAAKATQAKTDAITTAANDATTKANNAQAAAIAAASTDAAAKAGLAETNAIASAVTMTNGIGKNLSSPAIPTTSNTAPKGSVWRRTDGSGLIIGVWEQTGAGVAGVWTPRLITSETIDNLDIGKLSASAAAIGSAVVNKLVAATANFQTVDVKNLFVTTGTMTEAVIIKLWTDVVMSRKITAQMIAVGAFDNVIPDPDFTNTGLEWGAAAGIYTFPRAEGYLGSGAFKVAANASQAGRYSSRIPATGKASYRMTVWVKSDVDMPANVLGIYTNKKASASGGTTGAANWLRQADGVSLGNDPIAANTWTKLSCISETTETTYDFAVGLYVQSSFSAGAVWFSQPSATRMNAGELTVDGTVKARQLEAQMVLVNDIIAGNPLGTHAKMNANGFRVLASADGGAPSEVIRMGTDTDDYFGVANAAGELVASITSGGELSGQSLDVANDVTIAGNSLLERIAELPQGLKAWASRVTNGLYEATTAAHPYLHLRFTAEEGRAYMVETSPITLDAVGGVASDPQVFLHYEVSGGNALTTSLVIAKGFSSQATTATRRSPVTMNRLITPPAGDVSLLISYSATSGRTRILSDGNRAVILSVTDIGAAVPQTGESRDGPGNAPASGNDTRPDPTPPPIVKNYDKTWSATGVRSFIGSGGTYDYNTGYMYSGLSPSGYGDLSSMAVFPNLTGELSGATITGVWIYVYYDFWYQGSGGNAYIGFHGQTGLTGTRPTKTYAHAVSNSWPRAAGRWIPISSSTFAGWKAGTHRGITLGGSGGGYERYGYAHNPKIRIKYTK